MLSKVGQSMCVYIRA